MVYLTFLSSFNAVHRLWNDDLSREENERLYGECANDAGHGHLYKLEITVAAPVSARRPVVMARARIRRIIDAHVMASLQHANLDVAFGGAGFISTGERVTAEIWKMLEKVIGEEYGTRLVAVRVIETAKNSFVYYGESGPFRPGLAM